MHISYYYCLCILRTSSVGAQCLLGERINILYYLCIYVYIRYIIYILYMCVCVLCILYIYISTKYIHYNFAIQTTKDYCRTSYNPQYP